MVKNRHLAKSISDAAWTTFRTWVEYFGKVFGVVTEDSTSSLHEPELLQLRQGDQKISECQDSCLYSLWAHTR